jgi:competence protein ComEA
MRFIVVLLTVLALCLPLSVIAGPVNINKADAQTIAEELKGIGLAKAQAIVDYRQKHGPFKSPDDLSLVKGIGERTLTAIRRDVLVEDPKRK